MKSEYTLARRATLANHLNNLGDKDYMNPRPISLSDLLPPGSDPNDLGLLPSEEIIKGLSVEQKERYIALTKQWIILTRDEPTQRKTAKCWLRELTGVKIEISLATAAYVARLAEEALAPTYHVALAGSTLTKGYSLNDIDLKAYAHNGSSFINFNHVKSMLTDAGWLWEETINEDEAYAFTYMRFTSPTGFPVELSFIHHI